MIESLAYVGFVSPRAAEWASFGPQVLGLQLAPAQADGVVRLRMDDAAYRISVADGQHDGLDHLGWGVAGPAQFEAALQRVHAAGCKVVREGAELAASRCVAELASFSDPFGWRQEISWGQACRQNTFQPGRPMSGFVTGEAGLGHIVLISPDLARSEAFYLDVLGFRVTDEVRFMGQKIRFYNCNSRHHTLAMTEVPGMVGVHHLMLQVRSLDDVGTALDKVQQGAAELTVTLGRHCNDHMVSFYARTPAGFEIEYGWGAVDVHADESIPRMYDSGDIWGHQPVGGSWHPPGIMRPIGAGPGALPAIFGDRK
ncbi:MAG: VOC family protein [Ideonella sp.]|nr:VOC family protein [Ideonella sp.]MBL0150770.1 VOC family protein [Ideonella sp.]